MVKIVLAKILENSSNSFKNHSTSLLLANPESFKRPIQTRLSFDDFKQ